jgi:hypothetical protein
MVRDMVGRLVAEDEGDLVLIAGIGDQRQRYPDDRAAGPVERLEGVGRRARPVVDHDQEVAVAARHPLAADLLGHRLDPLRHRRRNSAPRSRT